MHRGEILKNLIKRSSYTQKNVAEGIGIDHQYFSRLLKNKDLRDEVIDKVCAFLGVDREKHFNEDALLDESDLYKKKYMDAQREFLEKEVELYREIMNLQEKISGLYDEINSLKSQLADRKAG